MMFDDFGVVVLVQPSMSLRQVINDEIVVAVVTFIKLVIGPGEPCPDRLFAATERGT